MDGGGRVGWIGSLAVALGAAGVVGGPPAISWAEASDSGSRATSVSSASSDSSPQSRGREDSPSDEVSSTGAAGPSADSSSDDATADAESGTESDSGGSEFDVPADDDLVSDADLTDDRLGGDDASTGTPSDPDVDVEDGADAADELSEVPALVDPAVGETDSADIPERTSTDSDEHGDNHSDDGMAAVSSNTVSNDPTAAPAGQSMLPVLDVVVSEAVVEDGVSPAEPVAVPVSPASRTATDSRFRPVENAEPVVSTRNAAPAISTAVLTSPTSPMLPTTPVPSVAPLAAYAWIRRDDEQSALTRSTANVAPHAEVEAAGALTPVSAVFPTIGSIIKTFESWVTAAQNWFMRTFFAATPTFSPQAVSVSVEPVTPSEPFTLTAEDADNRALTFGVHGSADGTGTAAGTLTVTGNTASYTPPASWDGVTPYTDTFSVWASDYRDSFHIHGLPGLVSDLTFGLLGRAGHTATTTLTVDVRAASTPPGPDPGPNPDPDGPGAPGTFPVSFTNDSSYADDDIYVMVIGQATPGQWSWVDRDGVAHHIDHTAADAPGHLEKDGVNYADMTFTLAEADGLRIPPELLGGRIYVSLEDPLYIAISADNSGWASPDGANPDDPNYDTVYDWYELSYQSGSVPFGGNTTQVDQFGFPFTFTVSQDSSGFSATRGIAMSRDQVFSAYEGTVAQPFQALIIRDLDGDPLRILSPRSHQPGDLAAWFDAPVEDFWNAYRTEEFVYDGPGYTVTGRIDVEERFAYTVTADGGSATSHTMTKPSTEEVFRADGPFVGTGLQGAFLAELDAAFNRGVATSPDDWGDASAYYPVDGRWNDWAHFFHAYSIDGFAYGFPYDDVNSQSSVVILGNAEPLTDLRLTLTS